MTSTSVAFISVSAFCFVLGFVVDRVACGAGPHDVALDVARGVPPKGGDIPSALPEPTSSERRLAKREIHRLAGHIHCSEVTVGGGGGGGGGTEAVKVVKEIQRDSYGFLLRPREDFQRVVFKMLIDNTMNVQPPYIYEDALDITRAMLEEATTPDQWHEFHVEYYKQQVNPSLFSLGRDKLALQVTVGNQTRPLITKRWWRTHSYSGFQISVEGGADFLFDCAAQSIIHNAPVSVAGQPLLLGGILGSCFLLVIAGWVLYLVFRRPRRYDYDEAPPVPELPKSLLLSMDKVSHAPDASHHIYEEFDEDTLSRLRQKMNAATLGECLDAPPKPSSEQQQAPSVAVGNEYDIPKGVPLRARPYERMKERIYENETTQTLIDEKIRATTGIRDSMPETHYIEMHGIVNRGSVDLGALGGQ